MFRFLCKSFHSPISTSELCKLYSTSFRKPKKPISFPTRNQDSFTVQYLMNQCGFSIERAVFAASKYLSFHKPDRPDSVLAFFKNQGFTDSQIKKVLAIEPRLLNCDIENNLLPKIQFFRDKGFSEKDIVKSIVYFPNTFRRSLADCIVPSFNFIRDFLGSEKDAISAISLCVKLVLEVECHVKPNIAILLGAGMSKSGIAHLMTSRPYVLVGGQDKLKEAVKQVQNLNMDPKYFRYGTALWVLTVTRRSTWDERMEVYKKWGCSEQDVLMSFRKYPNIMIVSEKKINGIMSFSVNEIGWKPSEVMKKSYMFTVSLKKTLIPRWSVYQKLLSKGLVKKKVGMSFLFKMKEDLFLQKFVNCYKDEAPFLLKLYIEKQASK